MDRQTPLLTHPLLAALSGVGNGVRVSSFPISSLEIQHAHDHSADNGGKERPDEESNRPHIGRLDVVLLSIDVDPDRTEESENHGPHPRDMDSNHVRMLIAFHIIFL